MATLKLGSVDTNSLPKNKEQYLSLFHQSLSETLKKKCMFRDEDCWRSFLTVNGNEVREVQEFLVSAGFLRASSVDGVFGYRTRAGVRLFQEYVRSMEGYEYKKGNIPGIGTPDGMVGKGTRFHMKRWQEEKLFCEWGKASSDNPSEEYTKWLKILKDTKEHFQEKTPKIIAMSEEYNTKLASRNTKSDTRFLKDWTYGKDEIHLIGIRRNEDLKRSEVRENDDVFIFLLNGMVFKFWGSTDPNPGLASTRKDEPFMIEGQHLYKLAWHMRSKAAKAYQALKPLSGAGPLVFRDVTGKDALTEENMEQGLQGPNNAINIHWSGVGSWNFSAGCQVIAGSSYINHLDEVVDCSSYAAKNNKALTKIAGQRRRTKGAYNVVADLVSVYRPEGVNTVVYTLGRDNNLDNSNKFKKGHARKLLKRMKNV
jgi:peptidoglycan hydrolase-like protein with peptidoglycan-binding domain